MEYARAGDVLVSGPDRTQNRLVLILSISYAANTMAPRWSFLALEQSWPLAVTSVLPQACFLAAAIFIQSPSQLLWVAGAHLAGESPAALFLLRILMIRCGRLTVSFDRAFVGRMVRQSW